jgi:chromate transporter
VKGRLKIYWDLFWAFFRIGGMTFGGGYAMLPMMKRELIERFNWVDEQELLDYYAIGQCTPGIIAVNTATFVGNKLRGLPGALVATGGMVAPSLVIILCIAAFIENFAELQTVQYAFSGIRVVVLALILDTVISLWKTGVKDRFGLCIAIFVLCTWFVPWLSSVWVVAICALAGILYSRRKGA